MPGEYFQLLLGNGVRAEPKGNQDRSALTTIAGGANQKIYKNCLLIPVFS
jgi:hypothetical protein